MDVVSAIQLDEDNNIKVISLKSPPNTACNGVSMNYQTEPITMWFDRRLVLLKSTIHNISTFATHDINAGELLYWL